MKTQQIQARFEEQSLHGRRKRTGRRIIGVIAAAAAAVMIGGTVTVGARNDWNYSGLMNRYFSEWFGREYDYSFDGQGIDINDTFVTENYELTVKSAVFNASSYYVFYELRFSDALQAQIDAAGSNAAQQIWPFAMLLGKDEEVKRDRIQSFSGHCSAERNAEGVYEISAEYPFLQYGGKPFTEDISGLKLAVSPGIICLTVCTDGINRDMLLEDRPDEDSPPDIRTYSLETVKAAPEVRKETPVTLDITSVVPDAPAKPFTFDSLTVSETALVLKYSSLHAPEAQKLQNDQVSICTFNEFFRECEVTLNCGFGKKQRFQVSRCSPDVMLNCYSLAIDYASVEIIFPEPVTLDGLKEIRINGQRIPLN